MHDQLWKKLGERYGYKGWRKMLIKKFELPNGRIMEFDILESPSYVTVIPVTARGQWICVRQYRPGPEKFMTGFPEGGFEDGETAEEAARRELSEETGYHAGQLIFLKSRRSAYFTQTQYFVLALDCEKNSAQELDDSEFIEVLELEEAELLNRLRSPDDAFNNIDAAYMARDYLSRNGS
jgi:ADP-ribose pyrophosphatase